MSKDKYTQFIKYPKLETIQNLKWEEVKTFVLPCLVPVGWIGKIDKRSHWVQSSFLDLSVCYYIHVKRNHENKIGTVWIKYALLEEWGISAHTLKIQAVKNMEKYGYTIRPMEEMIPIPQDKNPIPLYLLTSQTGLFGAAGILNMDTIATFAEEIDQNLYIIPSSIHELILLPDDGYIIAKDLEQMIKEINHTRVEPKDRLSNHVYYYNRITDEIQMEE